MTFDPSLAIPIKSLHTEFAEPAGCYLNVQQQVQKHGGKAAFGWTKGFVIFDEMPKLQTWIHHCVWEAPEGQLFELTPSIQTIIGDSILAVLSESSIFIPDPEAQLIKHEDGRYQSLAPHYTAIKHQDEKNPEVQLAIVFMNRADRALRDGNLRSEAYWCERAGKLLGGWISPHGEVGLKTMTPFTLEDI